jgi:hypothetical protein
MGPLFGMVKKLKMHIDYCFLRRYFGNNSVARNVNEHDCIYDHNYVKLCSKNYKYL